MWPFLQLRICYELAILPKKKKMQLLSALRSLQPRIPKTYAINTVILKFDWYRAVFLVLDYTARYI